MQRGDSVGKEIERVNSDFYRKENVFMKKMLAIILTLVLAVSFAPSEHVHAAEMVDPETGFRYEEIVSGYAADPNFKWEKEILVYVDNIENIQNFKRNPNYRYIFQWEEPMKARLACSMCGNSKMTTVRQRVQWGGDYLQCPFTSGPGLENDDFLTYYIYVHEKCKTCGYQTNSRKTGEEYEAYCNNDHHPADKEYFDVYPASQFIKGQHDVHQYLPWWKSKQLP